MTEGDPLLSDFLAVMPGSLRLDELMLPGSHDTMTSTCPDDYHRTQRLSLEAQLACGVRFVDLRLTRNMVAAHRAWISDVSAEEILETLAGFLDAHPGETVIARIQNANERKDDFAEYTDALHTVLRRWSGLFLPPSEAGWPTLDEARGKVVAFECAPEDFGARVLDGVRWAHAWHDNSRVWLQDLWDGPDPLEKQAAIDALLVPGSDGRLRLNHISATNGALGRPDRYAEILNAHVLDLAPRVRELGGSVGVQIMDFIDGRLGAAVIDMQEGWR